MKKKLILVLLIALISKEMPAQDFSQYEKHLYINKGDTLPYRLLLPQNYNPGKMYPMILFLHGSGERGRDNEAQLLHGGEWFLKDSIRQNYPAIIVFPQCSLKDSWVNKTDTYDSAGKRIFVFNTGGKPNTAIHLASKLVKFLISQYPITKRQLYVGGLSLGGMGTYEIVRLEPKLFVAAFPICGAADLSIVPSLKKVNWWIFHGAKDLTVNPQYSKMIVDELKKVGVPVKFTLYPDAGHNSWDNVFVEPGFMEWLFSNKK